MTIPPGSRTATNAALPKGSQTMSSALPLAANYHRWVLASFAPYFGESLLEVGFGYGQYTRMIAPLVRTMTAIDIVDENLALADKLPGHVRLAVADVTEQGLSDKVGHRKFQSILCLNVLEHIQNDIDCLANLRKCLAPDGRLLLLVPAFQALYGPMDELAGHFRRYSRSDLQEKLLAAGFTSASTSYFNPVGGLGWLATSRSKRCPKTLSDDDINAKILFFDKYLLLISRLINPLCKAFFGQSVMAVASGKIHSTLDKNP